MRIPDHFVYAVELPAAVRGVSVPNDDGTFSVYINSIYDTPSQQEALRHELEHLARDHFYRAAPVAEQEAEASGRAKPSPKVRCIRLYGGFGALEDYLGSIGALTRPLEELGHPY